MSYFPTEFTDQNIQENAAFYGINYTVHLRSFDRGRRGAGPQRKICLSLGVHHD